MDHIILVRGKKRCQFCGVGKNDSLKYGPLYRLKDVVAHYYCVLLSKRMIQNGQDNEGMLGFLLNDIKTELKRSASVKCFYCDKENASIYCAAPKCRRVFHLPCGMRAGSLHQFTGQFKSFCSVHRPFQNIPQSVLKEAHRVKPICCICYEYVNVSSRRDVLWAPCCSKTWYHKMCCQKLAHSAGYFFKCAICNDNKKFPECMRRYGIFIPQQDASWELVPNAFEELLFRYSNCDAEVCKCPHGRKENKDDTMWEIVLCQSCGSQGIHIGCGKLKYVDPEWECISCRQISVNNRATDIKANETGRTDEGSSKTVKEQPQSYRKKRIRVSEDLENAVLDKRKKRKKNTEEEDVEIDVETIEDTRQPKNDILEDGIEKSEEAENVIDVETVEGMNRNQISDIQEVLSFLKPGPLSYKLAVMRRELANSSSLLRSPSATENVEKIQVHSPNSGPELEVIELSDSDDEIQIVGECEGGTYENHLDSIKHYRVMKEPVEEEREEDSSEPSMEEDVKQPEISPTSPLLDNFEVVGAVNFLSPSKDPQGPALEVQPLSHDAQSLWAALNIFGGFFMTSAAAGELSGCANYVAAVETSAIAKNPETEATTITTDGKSEKTDLETEDVVIIDDDIEIILD